MPRSRIIEQVHGILAGQRIGYTVSDDGQRFHVPVPQGSAAVEIDLDELRTGRTYVRLAAHVLEEVVVDDDNRLDVLEHLNALNHSTVFGRFYLDADRSTIVLEHELLGDDLDASELMNALYTVGLVADQTDDELQRELGTGRRAFEGRFASDAGPAWRWPTARPFGARAPNSAR